MLPIDATPSIPGRELTSGSKPQGSLGKSIASGGNVVVAGGWRTAKAVIQDRSGKRKTVDLASLVPRGQLTYASVFGNATAVSADGKVIAVAAARLADGGSAVYLFKNDGGRVRLGRTIRLTESLAEILREYPVSDLALSPSGKHLAAAARVASSIALIDLEHPDAKPVEVMGETWQAGQELRFMGDSTLLFHAKGKNGNMKMAELKNGHWVEGAGPGGASLALDFTSKFAIDGDWLATSHVNTIALHRRIGDSLVPAGRFRIPDPFLEEGLSVSDLAVSQGRVAVTLENHSPGEPGRVIVAEPEAAGWRARVQSIPSVFEPPVALGKSDVFVGIPDSRSSTGSLRALPITGGEPLDLAPRRLPSPPPAPAPQPEEPVRGEGRSTLGELGKLFRRFGR